MTTSPRRRARYHHGDLREACVRLGLAQLARGGASAVNLRDVARRIGVSPRAPYRHFADKTEFLAALATHGFADFGARLTEVSQAMAHQGAPARLERLAQAYVAFAHERPALARLMFGDDFGDRSRFPVLDAAALATFEVLEGEVAGLCPWLGGVPLRQRAALAWVLVHGLAELSRVGQLAHIMPRSTARRALAALAVELLQYRPPRPRRTEKEAVRCLPLSGA